ncbi:MAG TPA: hypothetical protein VFG81_08335, partial [Anaerolineales bacterium]|nr:hypothetical protein [Anaerolineales bacterium]
LLSNSCRCGGGTTARGVRTPFGQSGGLRGLKLVPIKWRGLVPGEHRVTRAVGLHCGSEHF